MTLHYARFSLQSLFTFLLLDFAPFPLEKNSLVTVLIKLVLAPTVQSLL